MKQQTLTGFEKYGKTTRRAQFLANMNQIIAWPELAAAVQTVHPKISENSGRPPITRRWLPPLICPAPVTSISWRRIDPRDHWQM